jgi:hypothetical protein
MSSGQNIVEEHYTDKKPYVRARVIVVNLETGRQTAIEKDFWIDTGFDGGIHVAQSHKPDITMIGVNPVPGPISVAGGATNVAHRCLAYLQRLGDHEFPMPGIETELILHGSSRHGLIGLDILKHWIATFDGLNELLTIKEH